MAILADTAGGAIYIFSGSFAGDLLTVENNDAGSVGGAHLSGGLDDPVTTSIIEDSACGEQLWSLWWRIGHLEGAHSIENSLIGQ